MTIALSNLCYNCILTEEASSVACNCKKVISLFTSTTTFSRIPITVNVWTAFNKAGATTLRSYKVDLHANALQIFFEWPLRQLGLA